MSLASVESSVQDARPRFLYVIQTATEAHRFVSGDQDKLVSGELYTAVAVTHTSIRKVAAGEENEVVITIPRNLDAAIQLINGGQMPDTITATISKYHEGDGEVFQIFTGTVSGIGISGATLQIRAPSAIDDKLKVRLPILIAQRECSNTLGDEVCLVDVESAANKLETTIASHAGTTLVVASIGGHPDNWARNGKVVHENGEQRTVLEQIGTAFVIDYPFSTNTGNVAIYRGCDQTIETCSQAFNNVANFAGHPHLPLENPGAPTWWNTY